MNAAVIFIIVLGLILVPTALIGIAMQRRMSRPWQRWLTHDPMTDAPSTTPPAAGMRREGEKGAA